MGGAVVVRRAEPADGDDIYQVMRRSRREAFAGLLPSSALDWGPEVPDEFREFVRATVADEESALLVAVREETVVGLAELVWNPEGTRDFAGATDAELRAIHVRPAEWNEGIGTKLLRVAIDALPSRVSGVALCVLVENERARTFYEERGFEQTGTVVTTHGDDDVTEAVYHRPLQ
ncbi:GNAT family N-acetyltransferase [Halobacterium wangiae]|uniref:GNAT family N-acetyltransferase n=1 Tax=Halobacterium wangiae TaxID=2902623 RepID=UPI001E3C60CE|nr:GNAT family N-acetyltransferase [Halobacterium wangiae]